MFRNMTTNKCSSYSRMISDLAGALAQRSCASVAWEVWEKEEEEEKKTPS